MADFKKLELHLVRPFVSLQDCVPMTVIQLSSYEIPSASEWNTGLW